MNIHDNFFLLLLCRSKGKYLRTRQKENTLLYDRDWGRWLGLFRSTLSSREVEDIWESLRACALECLKKGIGERGKNGNISSRKVKRDSVIQDLKKLKREIWKIIEVRKKEGVEFIELLEQYKVIRKRIKNRVNWLRKKQLEEVVKNFEQERGVDEKQYWKRLKGMLGWNGKKDRLGGVLNDGGDEVRGREALDMWRKAWEGLGMEDVEDDMYDVDYSDEVWEENI